MCARIYYSDSRFHAIVMTDRGRTYHEKFDTEAEARQFIETKSNYAIPRVHRI